ncbi:MAG TPA: acetolactate decarboxylase, partial [Solirubrobacterales bacterium]
MSLDERWIRSLHVEAMRHADLHADQEPHVLFQASTIGALLEGAFEGDVTFAELAEHGDLGLGTVNHLDGEMIALDRRFYRADVDGGLHELPGSE